MGRFVNIFKSILLTEGRIEKARERYPDIDKDTFWFFANNDPSGNQKYLDWMSGEYMNGTRYYDRAVEIQSAVNFFHNNIQRFKEKDINKYKDLNELNTEISVIRVKIEQKRREKQEKQERDIVYNDDRWLVIAPKTHKASCKYGAGTKWCVASNTTSNHWTNYSRNATFFFIIDKTKTEEDPLYKAALRRIGRGDRYEIWNAPDVEISNRVEGKDYYTDLPEKLKEDIEKYHRKKYPEYGEDEQPLIDLDPSGQALANFLGHTNFEESGWHYGLPTYETEDGEEYAIGQEGEVEDAVREYYESYVQDVGPGELDPDGEYLTMTDEASFIESEVDHQMEELSDDDVLEWAGYDTEVEDLQEKLDDEDLDDSDKEDIENQIAHLVDESYDRVRSDITDDWEGCFRHGVISCLVNDKGWYGSAYDLIESGIVYFDEDGLIDSLASNAYYGETLGVYDGNEYDSEDMDGNHFYLFRIN